MWFTLAKVWLSLWITMIGLIEAGNEPTSNTGTMLTRATGSSVLQQQHPTDQAEERLRQRWTAFVAEANKELSFDLNASSAGLVSVVKGRDLFLTCAFTKPLRRHQVSFMRLTEFSLLFVGNYRHTRDQRFSAVAASDGLSWTLRLKKATFEDRGRYECQVNTDPDPSSLMFNVTVLPGRTRILPHDPVIYVNAGGQLSLYCVIETGPVRPQYILWYKEDKLVEYSSPRASVTLASNKTNSVSQLVIENVTLSDNGYYKCDSDLTKEASIQVNVVKQDFKSLYLGSHDKALISGSSASSSSSSSPSSSGKKRPGSSSTKGSKDRKVLNGITSFSSVAPDARDSKGPLLGRLSTKGQLRTNQPAIAMMSTFTPYTQQEMNALLKTAETYLCTSSYVH